MFWPGSLHILILHFCFHSFLFLHVTVPQFPTARFGCHTLQHFTDSENYVLIIKYCSTSGSCWNYWEYSYWLHRSHLWYCPKNIRLTANALCVCSENVTWTYLESPNCTVSLPELLNIHKTWTNVEKAQIPPTNKFPDGKRRHAQGNQTNQTLIQRCLAMPVLSLVKKVVCTQSPLFLFQSSDPSVEKPVFQRYHVTHIKMPFSWRKDLA